MEAFEGINCQGMANAKERIESIYSGAFPDTRKTIEKWIDGITVDAEHGDGFLGCKISEGKILIVDEDSGKTVSKLSSGESWGLWVDFGNLLKELGEGVKG